MINIFKKKPKECKHKYKDFPWYIEYNSYEERYETRYTVKIKEPYVCLLCSNRIDKTLCSQSGLTKREAEKCIDEFLDMHKDRIQDAAIVEDMVNDCQLVDKSFLESYEYSQKVTEDIMKSMHERPSDNPRSVSEAENKSGSSNSELLNLISDMKETFSKSADTAPDPRRLLELHNAQREKCTSSAEITLREPSTYLM